jgi:hypothetical protein
MLFDLTVTLPAQVLELQQAVDDEEEAAEAQRSAASLARVGTLQDAWADMMTQAAEAQAVAEEAVAREQAANEQLHTQGRRAVVLTTVVKGELFEQVSNGFGHRYLHGA